MNEKDEGDRCGIQGCSGILGYRKAENCSCYINPPCASCENNPLRCEECGWEEKIEHINGYRAVVNEGGVFTSWRPRTLDKTKIDYRIESHTHSSQKCIGVYPNGTTKADIEPLVCGTFGGRFERFGNGEFEYIAYTD